MNIVPKAATAPPVSNPVIRRTVSTGIQPRAKRVLLYSAGGAGKSTLTSLVPGLISLDLEGSTSHLDMARVEPQPSSYLDVRSALQDREYLAPFKAVAIDTITRLEELTVEHTLATVMTEKGARATSVEGYGFGKGYQYVFETFLPVLADLDRIVDSGKHVILLAHECTNDTPNPAGEDFLRYEPRLQSPKSGKASIRDRVFEWADIVGYVSFDVTARDGKGRGAGTRTVYFDARPTWRAKGRGTFPKTIPWNDPTDATEVLKCLN